jgi:DNA-binding HxlR family transcriptional regulator
MLTKTLRELDDGLVARKMYPEIPQGRIFNNRFWKNRSSGLKKLLDWGAEYLGKKCL